MTDPAILLVVLALIVAVYSIWKTRAAGGNAACWSVLLVCIYLLLPLVRKLLHV